MPDYNYKVIDWQGQPREGTYRADNLQEAAEQLRQRKYTILRLKERVGQSFLPGILFKQNRIKKTKSSEYMVFCRHFATMINAGFTVLRSLKVLGVQSENENLGKKIRGVALSVEKGCTLAQSMDEFPDVFPSVMTKMIEAGEAGGMLGEVLERLAAHYERQNDIEEKIRSALTYPVVVSVVALLVLGVMIFFVLPAFGNMFLNMGNELPLLTLAVLKFGVFVTDHWLVILIFISGSAFIFRFYTKAGRSRLLTDYLILKVPVVSTLYTKITVSRFARSLGSLLNSGVDIIVAMGLIEKMTDNRIFKNAFVKTGKDISDGYSMTASLKKSGLFPPMMVEMIHVGEETGRLAEMLNHCAALYEREVTYRVDRLASVIEPAVLVFVGIFVGILVVSLILPMFQIYEGM